MEHNEKTNKNTSREGIYIVSKFK